MEVHTMTTDETQELLNAIEGSYKNFLMGRNKQIVFKAWYEVMRNQDYSKINKLDYEQQCTACNQ